MLFRFFYPDILHMMADAVKNQTFLPGYDSYSSAVSAGKMMPASFLAVSMTLETVQLALRSSLICS